MQKPCHACEDRRDLRTYVPHGNEWICFQGTGLLAFWIRLRAWRGLQTDTSKLRVRRVGQTNVLRLAQDWREGGKASLLRKVVTRRDLAVREPV